MTAEPDLEFWAVRATADTAEIWTENGKLVAQFIDRVVADKVVESHNFEAEMERPEPPEVVKDHDQKQRERLAEWRKHDPTGARGVELIISASERLGRLLALNAPNIIIVDAIKVICDRAETLKALYPPITYQDDELEKT